MRLTIALIRSSVGTRNVDRPGPCGTIGRGTRLAVGGSLRYPRHIALLAAALVCAGPALAAKQPQRRPSQEVAFYRCKDAQGQTHFGDSRPLACEDLDTDLVGRNGAVIETLEGTQTRAAREQRELVEAKARKEKEERAQRDRMLIDTYVSVEDIERLRDQRLELLDAQYRVTEQNIRNLRERQARLEGQIARFKPYSTKPNAPSLPDHLGEEMVNTVNGMRVYEETLAKTRAEQAQIKESFAADIKRFKELRGKP